jgi:hypothetical protein
MMKKLICIFVLGLLLSACATKKYQTGSYSEYVRLTKADGYTYFAQAHMPKFIFKDGPSDRIHSDYGSGYAAHTVSQQEANRLALKRCNHEDCILSRIGDEITLDARNIMREKIRLAVIEKENIERSVAIEKERIANYKNKNSSRIENEGVSRGDIDYCISSFYNDDIEVCFDRHSVAIEKIANYKNKNSSRIKKAENEGVSRGNIDYCISSFYNDDIEVCFDRHKVNLASNKNSYSVADQSTNKYKKQCVEFGFKAGTENYGNCILRLMELASVKTNNPNVVIQNNSNSDAIAEQIERANEIEKNKVLLGISEKLLTKPQSRSTNCRTTVFGNIFNTNCN